MRFTVTVRFSLQRISLPEPLPHLHGAAAPVIGIHSPRRSPGRPSTLQRTQPRSIRFPKDALQRPPQALLPRLAYSKPAG